jgi:hypothetical protein
LSVSGRAAGAEQRITSVIFGGIALAVPLFFACLIAELKFAAW